MSGRGPLGVDSCLLAPCARDHVVEVTRTGHRHLGLFLVRGREAPELKLHRQRIRQVIVRAERVHEELIHQRLHVLTDEQWVLPEKFVKLSFWGINIGLALMVITNLFPEGILQVRDVLENGYWHARSLEFIGTDRIRMLEWFSMPSHLILIIVGVIPMVIASGLTYLRIKKA